MTHKDIFNKEIGIGDMIVGVKKNRFQMGMITRISDKGNPSFIPFYQHMNIWRCKPEAQDFVLGEVIKIFPENYFNEKGFKSSHKKAKRIADAKLKSATVKKDNRRFKKIQDKLNHHFF